MSALVMAAFGALLGAAVVAVVATLRGQVLYVNFGQKLVAVFESTQRLTAWVLAAFAGAAGVLALTGWPVAALWVFAGLLSVPMLSSPRSRSATDEIALVEAIATWTEQIRDTMGASAGLQQALLACSQHPPAALVAPLERFRQRAARRDLATSLRLLGDDLRHPASDLVIAGLVSASELDAGRLVPLLSRLAASIRAESDMRVRVEVSRARVRMSMRIVGVCVALTVILLIVAGGQLLEAYESARGQLWLLVVGSVVVLAGWSSRRLAEVPQPERFVARGVLG